MMSSSATASSSSPMATGARGSDVTNSDLAEATSTSPDNLFSEFRRVCQLLESEPSYNAKTKIVADFIEHGSSGGLPLQCILSNQDTLETEYNALICEVS